MGLYLLDSSLRCLNEGDLILLPPRIDFSFASDDLGDEYNENITARVMSFSEGWLNDLIGIFPELSPTVLRIKEITIPGNVKYIEDYAFDQCFYMQNNYYILTSITKKVNTFLTDLCVLKEIYII